MMLLSQLEWAARNIQLSGVTDVVDEQKTSLSTMQGTGPTAESLVYKATCANSGQRELSALTQELSGQLQVGELDRVLGDKQLFAVTCGVDGQKMVVAKTSLRLCRARDCASDCSNVHLCKFYLLGDCPHNRGRRVCRFSHDLYSDHNSRLLRQHHLQDLQREELCTLLLQNDGTLLPPVCFTYNRGPGEFGFCPDKDVCRRLHVCENYLRGTCHTGDCDRSHDFFEPHPMRALQGRGLSSGMVASLLPVFWNILAMRDSTSQGAHGKPREPEICLYHIKSFCKQGNRCVKVHFHLPYRWEFKDGQGWSMLTDNEAIERDYCDPSKTYSGGSHPVHFDTMTRNSAEVRRVSTVSAATHPNFLLTTRWVWYWEDEFGHWTQYATSEGAHQSSSMTCEELEKRYLEDSSTTVEFTAGKHTYELSMQDMIQSNKLFGTKRLVRRRPVFVSAADVQRIKTSSVQGPRGLPRHWDKQGMPETGFKRVKLDCTSQEYTAIVDLFSRTMSGYLVTSVERVQNRAVWDVFQWQADQMRKTNSGSTNEKILFHGTDAKHIDAICQQNFDWRLCGTHGTAYGKGSYFAKDASYAHRYTTPEGGAVADGVVGTRVDGVNQGTRAVFVCRVLAGEFTQGHPSFVRPPARADQGQGDGRAPGTHLFDTCVDDVSSPSIFVVFERHQVYPEYLLKYQDGGGEENLLLSSSRPRTSSLSSSSYSRFSAALSLPRQPAAIVTSAARYHRDRSVERRQVSSNSALTRASRGFGSLTSVNNLAQVSSTSPVVRTPGRQTMLKMTLPRTGPTPLDRLAQGSQRPVGSGVRLRPPPGQAMTRAKSIGALNNTGLYNI